MSKLTSRKMPKDYEGKLREVLFAKHINRDSLSRKIPQDIMMIVDFFISHLSGIAYCLLERSLEKDEKMMNQLTSIMQELIKDIEEFKVMLYEKEEDEK